MIKEKSKAYKSSDNIIRVNNIFTVETKFEKSFLGIKNFDKSMIPKKGQYSFLLTEKSMSVIELIDLIPNFDEAVFLFAKIDNKNLKKIEGYKHKITLITTDEFNTLQGFKRIISCATHTKAYLIKKGDLFISIIGSGNPSYNARIEQYQIFNSEEIYNNLKNGIC